MARPSSPARPTSPIRAAHQACPSPGPPREARSLGRQRRHANGLPPPPLPGGALARVYPAHPGRPCSSPFSLPRRPAPSLSSPSLSSLEIAVLAPRRRSPCSPRPGLPSRAAASSGVRGLDPPPRLDALARPRRGCPRRARSPSRPARCARPPALGSRRSELGPGAVPTAPMRCLDVAARPRGPAYGAAFPARRGSPSSAPSPSGSALAWPWRVAAACPCPAPVSPPRRGSPHPTLPLPRRGSGAPARLAAPACGAARRAPTRRGSPAPAPVTA
eukprot:XP_020398727.1 vegetative cell wall protein gp1-like [Zea mays]